MTRSNIVIVIVRIASDKNVIIGESTTVSKTRKISMYLAANPLPGLRFIRREHNPTRTSLNVLENNETCTVHGKVSCRFVQLSAGTEGYGTTNLCSPSPTIADYIYAGPYEGLLLCLIQMRQRLQVSLELGRTAFQITPGPLPPCPVCTATRPERRQSPAGTYLVPL